MTTESDPQFTLIAAGLASLDEIHPISEGRVTPHLTFDGEGFRVRHLAFDAGAVLPEHTAPAPVVISVVQGTVLFAIGGEDHKLSAGAVIQVEPGVPHVVTALEPSRLMLTLIG